MSRAERAEVVARIEAAVGAANVERDGAIGPLTTYRVGGGAWAVVTLPDEAALAAVATVLAREPVPVLVVGRGSNLLVADAGFDGVCIVLGEGFLGIDVSGVVVRAGGAVSLPVLARHTARAGLTGFEWAVGVPGSIGGAVRMNAGGHGSDMAATLTRVRFTDLRSGENVEVPAHALHLSYRYSTIEPHQVVVWAELSLAAGERERSEREIAEIVRWRREHQPGGQNAGSVFTNPEGCSAGELIDRAGLKGHRVGTAQVSPKHANFFQSDPGGSADDVYRLMVAVRDEVAARTGIRLEPETRLVGFEEGR